MSNKVCAYMSLRHCGLLHEICKKITCLSWTNEEIKNYIGSKFMKFIDDHPDKPWNWYGISSNSNITMKMIDNHSSRFGETSCKAGSDKPWDWSSISDNPNLTLNMIDDYLDKPWDWTRISRNPNITMKMIDDHPDKPWDWSCISYNHNITMKMIDDHPDKPWDW